VSREKDPGGFLDRWSARKRAAEAEAAAARAAGEPAAGAGTEPSEAGSVGTEADAEAEAVKTEGVEAETAEDDAEAIARLPSIDELTAETDLRPFLRRGVPAALKRAALRKMWTLNPAIRDYVDPARDYAWDWNAPGGVPGAGALSLPAAARALAALAGERPARPAPQAEARRRDAAAAPVAEPVTAPAAASAAASEEAPPGAEVGPPDPAAEPASEVPGQRRRHGGAMPRP
jgi:hypothetical protein